MYCGCKMKLDSCLFGYLMQLVSITKSRSLIITVYSVGVVKGVAFVAKNNEFLGNKNLEKSGYRFEKLSRWKKNTLGCG